MAAAPLSITLKHSSDPRHPNFFPHKPHNHHHHHPIIKPFTILCSTKPNLELESNAKSPTLADQLKPLSTPTTTTLLRKEKKNSDAQILRTKSKSIWVNPTKPRPSALSLHRQPRSASSRNPRFKNVKVFVEEINGCESDQGIVTVLGKMPRPVDANTAIVILNSIEKWERALGFFNWVREQEFFPMETILYNVLMKCLKNGKQFGVIEGLANEMVDNGIELDNITYCTIITCAKRCSMYDKAVEWFERMYATGLMPDEVTYCSVLDVYAKLRKVEEVLSLYERGRANGWTPDPVTFSVLCKTFGDAGDCNGIRYVIKEMKSLGVQPNLVFYNTSIEAMGKAGRAGFARLLFEDMVESGVAPNEKTLSTLMKIYGKVRWSRNAMELWERMRSNGWQVDTVLYNTLLSMFADLGQEEKAERLFEDMRNSENCTPDSFSFTAMVNVYANGGKANKAMELFQEMLELGVRLNVMVVTCLIQCLGKARRIGDLVEVYEVATARGVTPDDKLCVCLLSAVSSCDNKDDLNKVLEILQLANPRWASFVSKLVENEAASFKIVEEEFKAIITNTEDDARRAVCNCLIDICRNNHLNERAHQLLHLAHRYGIYPNLHKRTSEEWCLNVKTLSIGAALTAFEEWLTSLTTLTECQGEMPGQFSAYTGAGTHRFSQGLPAAFASHVKRLAAPFRPSEDQAGRFTATRDDLISWVNSRTPSQAPATA